MRTAKNLEINESLSELKKYQKTLTDFKARIRVQFLIYIKEKKFIQREHLAKALGKNSKTIRRWAEEFRTKGFENFIQKKKRNPVEPKLSAIHEELKAKVNSSINSFNSYKEVVLWVKENFDLEIKYQTARYYLITRFNTKLKVPRKSHCKKDPQKVEEYKKNTLCN